MKLQLKKKESNPRCFILYLDEEPWKDLHISIYGKQPQLPSCQTRKEWEEQFPQWEYRQAKLYSYHRLAAKSMHSKELEKMLRERFVSSPCIQTLLKELLELGYLNDRDWVESAVRSEVAKKKGPRAIAQKLKQKGVSTEEIERAMGGCDDEESQVERVVKLLGSKFKNRNLSDYKEKNKVIASLLRKGYDYATVKEALSRFSSDFVEEDPYFASP